jgi:hypothetical protein
MAKAAAPRALAVTPRMEEAWQAVDACFGRFCLTAGIEALQAMMATDVEDSVREAARPWSRAAWSPLGPHARQDWIPRRKGRCCPPEVHGTDGEEMPLASWTAATTEDQGRNGLRRLHLARALDRKQCRGERRRYQESSRTRGRQGDGFCRRDKRFGVRSLPLLQHLLYGELSGSFSRPWTITRLKGWSKA